MLQLFKIARIGIAIAVLVITGASAWAAAGSDIKIGFVDVERVYSDAPRMKQYSDQLEAFRQLLYSKLELRAQNTLLNDDEIKELTELKTKAKPAIADNDRIKALIDVEHAKDAELKTLQGSQSLSDKDKARLKELQDLQKKNVEALDAIQKDYLSQLQSRNQELMAAASAEIKDMINKIATAKGLAVVVAKEIAQIDGVIQPIILYGGTDITSDIITKLVAKAQ